MSNFKQATREKLRFQTTKGLLTTEQLWKLDIEDLDVLATSLDASIEESGKKSYLKKVSRENKTLQLQRDLVVEILTTLVEEQEAAQNAMDIKKHNAEIDEFISAAKKKDMLNLSVEELEKLKK